MKRRQSLLSKVIVGVSLAMLAAEGVALAPLFFMYRREMIEAREEAADRVAIYGPDLAYKAGRHPEEEGIEPAAVLEAPSRFSIQRRPIIRCQGRMRSPIFIAAYLR